MSASPSKKPKSDISPWKKLFWPSSIIFKLPHYFQAHTVVVLTQLPLYVLLQKSNYIGKVAKWGTILGAFDIRYLPQMAVKGQVLANLEAEFTEGSEQVDPKETEMPKSRIMINTISPRQP